LLLQRAKILLNEEALFKSFARNLVGKVEGKLIVGSSSEPGTRVGEMLAALRANHPLVSVDLLARPSSSARQGLKSGELDVVVLLGPPVDIGFTCHELTTVQYRVAGPVAWKAQIENADWAELASLPWLTPSASAAYSTMLTELFGRRGLEPNRCGTPQGGTAGRCRHDADSG
jgi:DNA-binding transcriptional LysR family regulator